VDAPRFFAHRSALLDRRNLIESRFSALQRGYKLSLDGAARTSAFDRAVTEALIATAFVTMGLLLLLAERIGQSEITS